MKVLVLSHGSYAESLIETGYIITGFSDVANFFTLYSDDNIKEYENVVSEYFEKYNDEILVLTDIQGGSPFNTVLKLLRQSNRSNICIITGINVPLYIEIITSIKFDECNLNQIIDQIKSIKNGSINIIN